MGPTCYLPYKHNRPELELPSLSHQLGPTNQPTNQPIRQPTNRSKMSQETVLDGYQGKYQDKYLASSEFGKEASGTIGDYLTDTINLVFMVFFLFLVLSMLTIVLTMSRATRAAPRRPPPSSTLLRGHIGRTCRSSPAPRQPPPDRALSSKWKYLINLCTTCESVSTISY